MGKKINDLINRGQKHKLFTPWRTNMMQNVFSYQVTDPWNNLQEDSLTCFPENPCQQAQYVVLMS